MTDDETRGALRGDVYDRLGLEYAEAPDNPDG